MQGHEKAVLFKSTPAGQIGVNGLFIWQGGLYVVLPDNDELAEAGKIEVRKLAAGWTQNPYARMQFGNYSAESFQADCPVAELLYNPEWMLATPTPSST